MSPPMISKAAAHYTGAGGKEHCSLCRHFSPRRGGRCARVLGDISPRGWCRLFSREMRGLIADASSFNGGAGGPALALDFLTPGTLDPRITFTRASSATYFDSAGVMRNAGYNALFPSVVSGGGWLGLGNVALGGSVVVPDGTTSTTALLYSQDTANAVRQRYLTGVVITASAAHTVSAYFKASPNNAYIQANATGGSTIAGVAYFDLTAGTAVVGADLAVGMTAKSAAIVDAGNGWWRCSFTFTTVAGNNALQTAVGPCVTVSATGDNRSYVGVVGQGVYAWGVQVERGAAATPYIPTTTAGNGAPRWDYDPATRALRGLLIEEARTNLALRSADLSNATAWVVGGNIVAAPVVTGNQAVAPDGTMSAARIVFPTVGASPSVSNVYQGIIVTAAQHSFSIWLRGSVGGEQVYVFASDFGAAYRATTLVTLTTAWQRVTITTSALTAGSWAFQIGFDIRDTGQTGKPAQTIFAWGAQVEVGAFATSYIPTTSAAVTRAIDVCQMPTAPWFVTAYSLAMDFDLPYLVVTVGGISDATFPNASYFNNSNFVRAGAQSAFGSPLVVGGAVNRQCGVFNPGVVIKVCNNGGTVATTATVGVAQSTATRLAIGNDPWSLTTAFNGHMRAVRYYARILADSEMQAVTNNPAAILLPAPDRPDRPDNELPEAPPTPEPKDDPDGR